MSSNSAVVGARSNASAPRRSTVDSSDRPHPPELFAVITWGCAGTKWLTQVLNGHPEIFCIHALRYCIDVADGVAARIDDVQVLSAVERMGGGLRLAGEVHGLARTSVPRLQAKFGKRFRCAGLVRSPAPRLRSQLALFATHNYSPRAWPNMEYVDRLPGFARVAGMVRSYEQLMFVHAVNMLNAVIEEQKLFPLYRLEDLSANAAALSGFIDHISGGCIEADEMYLTWAQSLGAPNSHVSMAGKAPRPFEDWQLDVIRAILHPEAIEAYQDLGYEIPDDWIESPAVRAAA
jgi:hypothetical protein